MKMTKVEVVYFSLVNKMKYIFSKFVIEFECNIEKTVIFSTCLTLKLKKPKKELKYLNDIQ